MILWMLSNKLSDKSISPKAVHLRTNKMSLREKRPYRVLMRLLFNTYSCFEYINGIELTSNYYKIYHKSP